MERGTIYPSWRYHRTEQPVLCRDAAHDAELGDEWADTPAAFAVAEPITTWATTDEPEPEAPKRRNKKA